jgi:toxin CcdB
LIPVFKIEGMQCLLDTQGLAAIPLDALTDRVKCLETYRAETGVAPDRLFGGF